MFNGAHMKPTIRRKARFDRRAYIEQGREAAMRLVAKRELVAAVDSLVAHLDARPETRPLQALVAWDVRNVVRRRAEAGDKAVVVRFIKGVS